MILYATVVEGMLRQMVDFATQISLGHMQVHRQAFIQDQDLYALLPDDLAGHLEQQVKGIKIAPRLYAAGLASAGDSSAGVMLKGVDIHKESKVTSLFDHVRQGGVDLSRGVDHQGRQLDKVVIGAQLARNMGVAIGEELVLMTQAADGSIGNGLYLVTGILKPIEPNFDRSGVLLSIDAFRRLMFIENGVHELVIASDDIDHLDESKQIVKSFLDEAINTDATEFEGGPARVRIWREMVPAVADMMEMSKAIIYVMGLILFALASFGMFNTVMMSVYERRHEFGVLLCVGMGRYWLLIMVLLESLLLSLVAAIVGSILGIISSLYFEKYGIDYSGALPDGFDYGGIIFEPVMKGYFDPANVFVGVAFMVVVAMLAALVPSWQTVRLQPAQVLQ